MTLESSLVTTPAGPVVRITTPDEWPVWYREQCERIESMKGIPPVGKQTLKDIADLISHRWNFKHEPGPARLLDAAQGWYKLHDSRLVIAVTRNIHDRYSVRIVGEVIEKTLSAAECP